MGNVSYLRHRFRQTIPVRAFGMDFDAPVLASIDPWALALATVAGIALFRLKLGVTRTLAICSAASVTLRFVLGVI